MKKEILVLVLLICIMLIGCAKTEDPRNTGSTMGEPDASVSEQNSDVLPTDGSSSAPEPTDITEPTDNADEDADLYKLPTVIGTYTDIYAEIGGLEVMHYYPFSEYGSEEYKVSKDTTLTLDDCDEKKEEKNCAIFIGEDNTACLICRNSSVEKLLLDGYIWDFSETGFSFYYRYPITDALHKDIEELSEYDNRGEQIALYDGGIVFMAYPTLLAIKADRAYRLKEDMLLEEDSRNSKYLISNGRKLLLETVYFDIFGSSDYISISMSSILLRNIDPKVAIGYRAIGIDFSRSDSPFYVERDMTIDEYAEKRLIHGSSERLAELEIPEDGLESLKTYDKVTADYLAEVRRRIIDRNATKISEVVEIYKEIGDLK